MQAHAGTVLPTWLQVALAEQPPLATAHDEVGVQVLPSPPNPALQVQVKLPAVLVQLAWAAQIREWMASYAQAEDLINIGAYVKGANAKIDQAVFVQERINQFLRQAVEDPTRFQDTRNLMQAIVRSGEAFLAGNAPRNK